MSSESFTGTSTRWRATSGAAATWSCPPPRHDGAPQKPNVVSRPQGFLVFRITWGRFPMAYRTPWHTALATTGPKNDPCYCNPNQRT